MKKPYLMHIQELEGLHVWVVDGAYVRKNREIEFTNFGHHYSFPFIPKDELWLDRENVPGEMKYFIPRLLLEQRLMARGMSYKNALAKGGKMERELRAKDMQKRFGFGTPKQKAQTQRVLRAIHKKRISRKGDALKIWIISGELVRSCYYIDFTQGGHEYVYPFVPKGEVWLDDDLAPAERRYVLLHELHERRLMSRGLSYSAAHKSASKIELFARRHPRTLAPKLKKEHALSSAADLQYTE